VYQIVIYIKNNFITYKKIMGNHNFIFSSNVKRSEIRFSLKKDKVKLGPSDEGSPIAEK